MEDPYNLQRFVDAQQGIYAQARSEIRRGQKTSHWMWFIFPQSRGLGQSPMAVRYAIASLSEAEAYLQHPLLGQRLRECCELLLTTEGKSISEIMGCPDDLKLKSSMTLFSRSIPDNQVFLAILEKYFSGEPDDLTLKLLRL